MITISTDSETDELIKKIREMDESFNLSRWFREAIYDEVNQGKLDQETIIRRLTESKNQVAKAEAEVKIWESKQNDFLKEIEQAADNERNALALQALREEQEAKQSQANLERLKRQAQQRKEYDKYIDENKLDFRKFTYQNYLDKFNIQEI